MTQEIPYSNFAEFLSDLSVAVVVALKTQDPPTVEKLAGHLTELVQAANATNESELAAYFGVLHGLLRGEDVTAAAETLVGPYRAGYERILRELEEEPAEDLADMPFSEWLASMTGTVATTLKRGSAEDRADLEQALATIAGRVPPEDHEFQDFIAFLRGVVRGEDTRALVVRLKPPFREAGHSLLQLLAADDTTEFAVQAILDRIQHNTIVALSHGDAQVRAAVAEALSDLENKVPDDDPVAVHFAPLIAGARALLRGDEPPASVNELPEPFAETWRNILAASQK